MDILNIAFICFYLSLTTLQWSKNVYVCFYLLSLSLWSINFLSSLSNSHVLSFVYSHHKKSWLSFSSEAIEMFSRILAFIQILKFVDVLFYFLIVTLWIDFPFFSDPCLAPPITTIYIFFQNIIINIGFSRPNKSLRITEVKFVRMITSELPGGKQIWNWCDPILLLLILMYFICMGCS